VKDSSKSAELELKLAYNSSTDVAAVATNPRRLLDLTLHQYLQKPQILIEFQNLSFVSGMKVSIRKINCKFMGSGVRLSVTYSSPQKPKSYLQRDLPDYPFCFQQQ
jgi:hypothetical protein